MIHCKSIPIPNKMKNYIFFMLAGLLCWSCFPTSTRSMHSVGVKEVDSTSYELIIIDPGFETWYDMNFSPAKDRSNEAYQMYNHKASLNWNHFFTTGRHSQYIDSYINYENQLDYGIELNRKLYWYFRYIEEISGLKLLN